MPYYLESDDREALKKLLKYQVCTECGSRLEGLYDLKKHLPYLQCKANPEHEGIEKVASQWQQKGLESFNIPTRRKIMVEEYGTPTTKALDKYMGVVSLTKPEAKEILLAIYPNAPEPEIARAVLLCASYGLNPLMKHVFLIPFKRKKDGKVIGEDWVTVMGIKAKRLLSSRRGNYSYTDNTPRIMTDEEQRRTFGEIDGSKLWVVTKIKDPQTGAEAIGYGFWPRGSEPYGTEKGNTKFNMAAIRSESQALDRLRPGEMPEGIEVMPEEAIGAVVEGQYKEVSDTSSQPETEPQHRCEEHNCDMELMTGKYGPFYAHKLPSSKLCTGKNKKNNGPKGEAASSQGEETNEPEPGAESELDFDPAWLLESLKKVKWQDSTVKSYLKNVYKVDTEGTVVEVVARLTREDREKFFAEIQSRLQMV